jgi:hypothetical protein
MERLAAHLPGGGFLEGNFTIATRAKETRVALHNPKDFSMKARVPGTRRRVRV